MKACKVDEAQLTEWIDGAMGSIRYLGPAITPELARRILAAEKRTGQRNHVVMELDDEMDRSGYGQTAAVRVLHDGGATLHRRPGLRVAALTAPGLGVVWSPIAQRVDPIDRVSVNGIWMEGSEQRELLRWIGRMMGEQATSESTRGPGPQDTPALGSLTRSAPGAALDQLTRIEHTHDAVEASTEEEPPRSEPVPELPPPDEPEVKISDLDEGHLKQVERHLREHPPRDFQKENETEVYQGYVGFIEIHVTGASLASATSLAIPKKLTELGLETDLRDRLSEKMRIDLSGTVDLGASDVNKRVDAFREIFTKQMGPPLGRIYRKSDWDVMQAKWAEIERLVEVANKKIEGSLRQAVQKIITDAARHWANAIAQNPSVKDRAPYTEKEILTLLNAQWDQKQRATAVKVHLFAKDLTWATLNDRVVRRKIEEAYPELRETGLYQSRHAWAS